jgi:hypothetical protein
MQPVRSKRAKNCRSRLTFKELRHGQLAFAIAAYDRATRQPTDRRESSCSRDWTAVRSDRLAEAEGCSCLNRASTPNQIRRTELPLKALALRITW